MAKVLKIRDLTLRDGQQSQLATRMNQEQVDRVLPYFKKANFYAMEVWGGAVPDSVMRYLNENPWERLAKIKEGIGDTSLLTALSRGRNLFGYNPYPDDVIEGFNRNAIETGIDIMRIFDALNDIDNMKSTIEVVKKNKGKTDCAICYTVDSKVTFMDRLKAGLKGKKLPGNIFDVNYFVGKAVELESLGADIITIKDMAGLIHPSSAGTLYRELKKNISVPIDHHSHCTPGFGLASALMAIVNGVDIIDTVILNFSGGPAAPAFELIELFARKLGYETGVNVKEVAKINRELVEIRKELSEFDSRKSFPRQIDLSNLKLPSDVDKLFDDAIEAAKAEKPFELLKCTREINEYFDFPTGNEAVREAQIPGGMYTNMLAQLNAANMGDQLNTVLKEVPIVRIDSGVPPLVTPTSQIVGVQAVNNVLDMSKDKPRYTSLSNQFVQLVQGGYGKTPFPVDPEFRKKITGEPTEIPYDTSKHKKQENQDLPEYGENVKLAMGEKEELLLELFPAVATGFLRGLRDKELEKENNKIIDQQNEELAKYHAELLGGLTGDYQSIPE